MLLHLRARVRAAAANSADHSSSRATPSCWCPRSRRSRPGSSRAPQHDARTTRSLVTRASSTSPSSAQAATTTAAAENAADAADDENDDYELILQVAPSMSAVPAREWDAVAVAAAGGPERMNPFVSHAFLSALEESGSAQPRAGWAPQHLLVRLRRRQKGGGVGGGVLVGCAPVYLKGHSAGEYVFDHSWAEFHEARGGSYYPKVLCAVPFTPVQGPRLMAGGAALDPVARRLLSQRRREQGPATGGGGHSLDDARRDAARAVRRALISGLRELADEYGCSGAHCNFCTAEEQEMMMGDGDDNDDASAAASRAFLPRYGWQYHWENRGYGSFADFEADLRQSRRKSVRQERKGVAKQGLVLRRRKGDELSAGEWDRFHDFYLDTVDRRWGRPYLTRDFFARLGGDPALAPSVLMVTAHEAGGGGGSSIAAAPPSASNLVAGALNLSGGDALFGRNWGAAPGRADATPFLHFALCYYEAVEHAIESGLARVEAGAQGEHKLQRGYLPALTRSAHYLRAADPPGAALKGAVARFLRSEAREVAGEWERLSLQASPFKERTTAEVVSRRAREYLSAGGLPLDLARAAAAGASGSGASSADGGGEG